MRVIADSIKVGCGLFFIFDFKRNIYRFFLSRVIKGKVIVTPLPLISTEGMTSKDIDDLINKTRDAMTAAFNDVNKEMSRSLSENLLAKSHFS